MKKGSTTRALKIADIRNLTVRNWGFMGSVTSVASWLGLGMIWKTITETSFPN